MHQVTGSFGNQSIQADTVDDIHRVQAVALRLGHLLAGGIGHQAVDVDLLERYFTGEFHRHHDHAGNPQADDVVSCHHNVGRVKRFQFLGLFGPAQGRESPKGRREPGIQNIGILHKFHACSQIMFIPCFLFTAPYIDVAIGVIPGGNSMSPPELPGDTPVFDVSHP